MSLESFYHFINNFERLEKHYEKLYLGFSKKLPIELTNVVLEHKKVLRTEINLDSVHAIAEKYCGEIWESYNTASWQNEKKAPVKTYKTPKPISKEEARKKLEEEKVKFPKDYHETYEEYFWEDFERSKRHSDFLLAVLGKMKEILAEFYLEDILKLESDYLRYLDSSIYLMCADRFVQEIYELDSKRKNKV